MPINSYCKKGYTYVVTHSMLTSSLQVNAPPHPTPAKVFSGAVPNLMFLERSGTPKIYCQFLSLPDSSPTV